MAVAIGNSFWKYTKHFFIVFLVMLEKGRVSYLLRTSILAALFMSLKNKDMKSVL